LSRSFLEIVTSRGYKVEEHFVETQDGYILRLFRIPSTKNSTIVNQKPCLLLHGILDSSDSFVLHYEEKSYSYVLVNSGYDVWIGNNRGNKHSRNHTKLNADHDKEFWNYTYQEMVKYDLPAMIDYILNFTNKQNLTYFGHSQGTMQMFAAASENSAYFAQNVNGVIALGPATKLGNLSSRFVRYLLAIPRIDYILRFIGVEEFLSSSVGMTKFTTFLCDKFLFICDKMIELLADSNSQDDDQNKLPTWISHYPAGSSLKSFSHLLQSIRTDKFAKYDYGKSLNQQYYGTDTPPEYNLRNIKGMKFCVFAGSDDRMASVKDSRWIRDELEAAGVLTLYKEVDNMGHLTFFIPKNVDYFNDIKTCLTEFEK